MSESISNPYIKTYLETVISLQPRFLNNNMVDHIKTEVIQKHVGKCYKHFGYISKIYKFKEEIDGGFINAEDLSSSPKLIITFLCKLCNPLKNSLIVAQIVGIHRLLIYAQNGPISIIIKNNFINPQIFYYNTEKNIYIVNINNQKKTLESKSYVLIRVIEKKIINDEQNIIVMGYLVNIATENDWKKTITDEYNDNISILDSSLITL